jgi:two-component system nitrate/nitrite response regulator NarL
MIRILIIDETRLLADLKAAALRTEADIEVVGCVCTVEEALKLGQNSADIVLASVTLPQEGAVRLIQAMQKNSPMTKVLLTGLIESKTVILSYLEHGAAGYVLMEDSWTELLQKIRATARGECLISSEIAAALVARLCEFKQIIGQLNGMREADPVTLYASLTEREGEILALIEQGYTNLQIGAALCIELGTVKNHVHNLLDKLGVPSRSQAALVARQALGAQMGNQSDGAFLTSAYIRSGVRNDHSTLEQHRPFSKQV